MMTMPSEPQPEMSPEIIGFFVLAFLAILVISAVMFVVIAPVYGYWWRTMALFQTDGLSAMPLRWAGQVKSYWVDGLKVGLYMLAWYLVVYGIILVLGGLPFLALTATMGEASSEGQGLMILLALPLYLLMMGILILGVPFLMAPIYDTASDRRLAALFDRDRILSSGKARFGQTLWVLLYWLGLMLVYVIPFYLLAFISGGLLAFFAQTAGTLSGIHLLAQAYGATDTPSAPSLESA
jgi:hypothetical protein